MQSATIGKLVEATSKAQGEMRAAPKDSVNPFFKSNYSGLFTCVEEAREILAKYGLAIFQTMEPCSGETQKAEKIFWVLRTKLAHISGEYIDSLFPLTPKDWTSQAMGSAVSYARRYTFQAIINQVSGSEDDDGSAASGVEPMKVTDNLGYAGLRGNNFNGSNATYRVTDSSKTTFAATESQIVKIGELSRQLGWDVPTSQKWLVENTNKSTRALLTELEADWCIEQLLKQTNITRVPPQNFTLTNPNTETKVITTAVGQG